MATTSLKLDPSVKERVRRLAAGRRRSAHWLMVEAINEYVEREEKRAAFLRDGIEAWEDYKRDGLHATAEEVDAWLLKLAEGEEADPPECHL